MIVSGLEFTISGVKEELPLVIEACVDHFEAGSYLAHPLAKGFGGLVV